MRTIYEHEAAAPTDVCFQVAADVERWPDILRHYRRVRFLRRDGFATGLVEMAAWLPLGAAPIGWPTWWLAEMRHDAEEHRVMYQHVYGITSGMYVLWEMTPTGHTTSRIRILYEWIGPGLAAHRPLRRGRRDRSSVREGDREPDAHRRRTRSGAQTPRRMTDAIEPIRRHVLVTGIGPITSSGIGAERL